MRKGKIELTDSEKEFLHLYLKEIGKYKPLSRKEELELAKRIQQGDKEALDKLVKANLKFVVNIAKRYRGLGLSLPDLINEGNLGLVEAAKRYKPDKKVKFITYAVWWIKQSIMQAISSVSGAIKVPLKQIHRYLRINRKYEELSQKLGREPTIEEIAKELKLSPITVKNIIKNVKYPISLEKIAEENGDKTFIPMEIPDPSKVEDEITRTDIIENIHELLSMIKPRERQILLMHYGINRERPMTFEEIGEELGLTRERVRQIEEKVIKKLRRIARRRKLQDLLT